MSTFNPFNPFWPYLQILKYLINKGSPYDESKADRRIPNADQFTDPNPDSGTLPNWNPNEMWDPDVEQMFKRKSRNI